MPPDRARLLSAALIAADMRLHPERMRDALATVAMSADLNEDATTSLLAALGNGDPMRTYELIRLAQAAAEVLPS